MRPLNKNDQDGRAFHLLCTLLLHSRLDPILIPTSGFRRKCNINHEISFEMLFNLQLSRAHLNALVLTSPEKQLC
jgi:hypothetical protein